MYSTQYHFKFVYNLVDELLDSLLYELISSSKLNNDFGVLNFKLLYTH